MYGVSEARMVRCLGMQACDNLLLTREAITAMAARHGLAATFLPKLWADAASSGCHCHFSLWQVGLCMDACFMAAPNAWAVPALAVRSALL